jgi:hypothetical protein
VIADPRAPFDKTGARAFSGGRKRGPDAGGATADYQHLEIMRVGLCQGDPPGTSRRILNTWCKPLYL